MAILEIIQDPNPVLRKKAKPVERINAAIKRLLDDMAATMYEAPGVGLAAPQVGISKRVVVIDPGEEGWGLVEMINPEILVKEDFGILGTEGCLSIPGKVADVARYRKVRVTFLDRHGRHQWVDAEEWIARIIQHEIDHLDGVLYTDKCTNFRNAAKGEDGEDDSLEGAIAANRARRLKKAVEARRKLRLAMTAADETPASTETPASAEKTPAGDAPTAGSAAQEGPSEE